MNVRTTITPQDAPAAATLRDWFGLALLLLPALLVSMDVSILFVASPAISQDLAPTATQWLWMMDSYSLVVASLLVTMGNLADRIGRRRLLLIGSVGFGVASIMLAFAPTPELFIMGRVLLGIGAATLAPSTLAIVRSMFLDGSQRRKAVAAWTVAFTGGAVLGPILGGLLLDHFAWGSVFLVNLPVMALLLILAPVLIPESKDPRGSGFDIPGAVLSLATLCSLVYALKRFAEYGADVLVWGTLCAGVALMAGFLLRQQRAAHPLIDVALFRRPAFSGAVCANMLASLAMVGLGLLAFTYLQSVLGMTPLQAALVTLPTFLGTLLGAALGSTLATTIRPGVIVAAGQILGAAAMVFIALSTGAESVWLFIGGYTALTFGVGMVATLANSLILATAPQERAGAAASISETGIQLGGALGIAGFGTISSFVYRAVMDSAGLQVPEAASSSIGGAEAVAADFSRTEAAQLLNVAASAFAESVGAAGLVAAVVLLFSAAVTGVLLRRVPAGATADHPG